MKQFYSFLLDEVLLGVTELSPHANSLWLPEWALFKLIRLKYDI